MPQQFIKYFVTFVNLSGINQEDFPPEKKYFHKLAKESMGKFFCLMLGLFFFLQSQAAYSKVIRLDEVDLGNKHFQYLYEWYDSDIKPKAIVIAIHGLTLHGLVYDRLACHLAEEGLLVLAPDLPGYGRRWQKDPASYFKAQENIIDILVAAKAAYKDLPIVCLGESLGSNLALGAAQLKPDLVDGVIMSSPALKTRVNITPKTTVGGMNLLVSLVKTDEIVDLAPYMRAYASEDPIITKTMLDDPLIHKQLKGQDIWESYQGMRPVYKQASLISTSTPVLIMQGKKDKILDAKAIIKLVSSLNSEDQTVKWFKNRGHMMLEECQPKPDVLQTVDDWFRSHIIRQLLEAKTDTVSPQVSSSVPVTSPAATSSLPSLTQAVLSASNNSN